MLRRLRRLFEGRRYRDASYARPDVYRRTRAGFFEKLMRGLRRREMFGYDQSEVNTGVFIRTFVGWGLALLLLGFLVKSLLVLNIFAG